MCGESSGKPKHKGYTKDQVIGMFAGGLGGMVFGGPSGVAAAADFAKGGSDTTGNTDTPVTAPTATPTKETMGAPAKASGTLFSPRGNTSLALAKMDDDMELGNTVNAADYVNKDYAARQTMSQAEFSDKVKTAGSMAPAEREMGEYGKFEQTPGSYPLNRLASIFKPNRGVGGQMLDSILGRNRNLPMSEAVKKQQQGVAGLVGENLEEGNLMVSEGKVKEDKLGIALDVATPLVSLARGNFLSALLGGVNAADTMSDMKELSDVGTKMVPTTAPAQKSAMASNPYRGMMGNDKNDHRVLMSPTKAKATTTTEDATVTTTTKRPRVGRSSLLLTGGQGVTDKARVFFTGLGGI